MWQGLPRLPPQPDRTKAGSRKRAALLAGLMLYGQEQRSLSVRRGWVELHPLTPRKYWEDI